MTTETETNEDMTLEMVSAQWSKLYCDNPQFRADFDADPRETLGKLVGTPVPAEVNVVVHRRQSQEIHIVLPSEDELNAAQSGELSEDMLMQVSAAGVPSWVQAIFQASGRGELHAGHFYDRHIDSP